MRISDWSSDVCSSDLQNLAQRRGVRDIAVMRDREPAGREVGEQRLDVAQRGLARRRIADMADRRGAGELPHDVVAVEIARDMTHRAVRVEFLAVEGGDAGGLLTAMLERVEAERDHRGGAVGAMDTKDAALLTELVVVERV